MSADPKAQLSLLFEALMALHKELIDAQIADYESRNGPVPSPHQRFRLLVEEEEFQWLRALSTQITTVDAATDRRAQTDTSHLFSLSQDVVELLAEREDNVLRHKLNAFAKDNERIAAAFATVEALLDPYRRG